MTNGRKSLALRSNNLARQMPKLQAKRARRKVAQRREIPIAHHRPGIKGRIRRSTVDVPSLAVRYLHQHPTGKVEAVPKVKAPQSRSSNHHKATISFLL